MPKFEFYVLHYDPNARKIEMWNIFNNHMVYNDTLAAAEKYAASKISYDELRKEIDNTIKWQEWSRYQYEISAGPVFVTDPEKQLTKVDAYYQAHANIDLITKMVIDRMFDEVYHLERY